MSSEAQRIQSALEVADRFGGIDGAHHKQWVIDQMVRALTDCPIERRGARDVNGHPYMYLAQGESEHYRNWVENHNEGDEGPDTYAWDTGTAP